jgi:hypothetical protein
MCPGGKRTTLEAALGVVNSWERSQRIVRLFFGKKFLSAQLAAKTKLRPLFDGNESAWLEGKRGVINGFQTTVRLLRG